MRRPFDSLARWPTALALLVLGLLAAIYLFLSRSERPGGPVPGGTPEPESGCIQAYFTDPGAGSAKSYRGGPDEDLARAIDQARYSVDVAVLRLDLWSVRDALIRAHRRGATVRVVTDSDNLAEDEIGDLMAEGIEVEADGRDSLMHHKFVVIDGVEVWTGSMNLTVNGAYRNDNNLVRLRSPLIAEDYTREFEEMFLEHRYGPLSRADTPHRVVEIEGSPVEVWFSPDDGVAARLAEMLRGAHEDIEIMAFAFTLDALESVVAERSGEGVRVRGVIEADQAGDPGTELDFLRTMGVDQRLDGNPNSMHHKVIILDGAVVITGSYNFSYNAEEINDENVLIIHNAELAAQYEGEFERVFGLASR
jgi:phosphatidylserine/phosphatidylglycerophosphate/cardiolipin synthase-like enzyme